jgi:hypothetical protein
VALGCDRGDGFFLYPDSFTGAFKRLARQAGLHPSTRLHDVRHAVATELGRRGVHPVIVLAVLGHASPAFTVAVYQHAWEEGPAEAAAALQAALSPSRRSLAIGWHGRQSSSLRTASAHRTSRSDEWGGLDSNQRPTDYESAARASPHSLHQPGVMARAAWRNRGVIGEGRWTDWGVPNADRGDEGSQGKGAPSSAAHARVSSGRYGFDPTNGGPTQTFSPGVLVFVRCNLRRHDRQSNSQAERR